MTAFFSALNPVSSNSGITFRATRHRQPENMLQQNMPDLTLDLVIPFLWSRNLSILDGIYETFIVIMVIILIKIIEVLVKKGF